MNLQLAKLLHTYPDLHSFMKKMMMVNIAARRNATAIPICMWAVSENSEKFKYRNICQNYTKTTNLFFITILCSFFGEGKTDDTSTETWMNFSIKSWGITIDIWTLVAAVVGALLVGVLLGMPLVTCASAVKECYRKIWVNAPVVTENTLQDVETVIKVLKKLYPEAEKVTDYTACDCVITSGQDDPRNFTSNGITQEKFFNNSKRVLIIGKEGYGKTYLLQYLLQQWANGDILKDSILIYIHLGDLYTNSCILEAVVNSSKGNIKSVDALYTALQQREALVLLDGLSHLKLESDPATKTSTHTTLTVQNILYNQLNNFPRLKVWATVRPNKGGKLLFPLRDTSVNLSGFTDSQRKTYLKKTIYDNKVDDGTEHIEELWKNIFKIDSNVKKSPLLTYIFSLLLQETFTKEYCYQKFSLNFSLTDNVYVFWALCKYWNIDNWWGKFEGKDVVFDMGEPGYSKELMKDVLTSCLKYGVTLNKLTFRGDFPQSAFKSLPNIKTYLISERVKLREGD